MATVAQPFDDSWMIRHLSLDRAAAAHHATTLALANGRLGVRGGLEELDDCHGTILADLFQKRPVHYHERFPGYADTTDTRLLGPGVTAIHIHIDGQPVDFSSASLLSFDRRLDLRRAVLEREAVWRIAGGRTLRIAACRMVPLADEPVCVTRLSVEPLDFTAAIDIDFPLAMQEPRGASEANDPRINAKACFAGAGQQILPGVYLAAFTAQGGGAPDLYAAQRIVPRSADALVTAHHRISARAAAGMPLEADRLVAVASGASGETSIGALNRAADAGVDRLTKLHQAAVDAWWRNSEMAIAGNADLTLAIRFNLLHLFMSAGRGAEASIAAKGLTGEGYEGHYFWDTEVFVLPVLALTQPQLARTILSYRVARLDKARANARALGHMRGALFPWRTISGDECSTHYPTGAAQYHVNAAVAFALETYLAATCDRSILLEGAADMLVETARLWVDLGHFSARRGGAFVIHGVTGPDEYTALVDNDFYTNAMARRHLRFAVQTIEGLGETEPDALAALQDRLQLDPAEIGVWQRAADHMWLPLDAATGVHPQDDSFMDKPEFPALHDPARPRPLLLGYHPMVLFRHRLCKQGDVLQAHHIGALESTQAQLRRDYAYYEPLTTHDSTLSMTAFGIAAARLGKSGQAMDFHRETALIDIADLHGNSSHGAHMAAMAGSWLILAQGWAGLRIDGDCPELAPCCPAEWGRYSLRFSWRGRLIELEAGQDGSCYRLIAGEPLELLDHGRLVRLGRAPVTLPSPAVRAVIFDLDGVLTDTAEAHFKAWKRLCDEEGIPFDRAANEALKGVDRRGSLALILASAGRTVDEAAAQAMMARKNGYYLELIADYSPADLFPGARTLLRACQRAGLRIGLASASRNAPQLLDRLGIGHFFDHVVDAGQVTHGKPDPEIFLTAALALGIEPGRCVGIEDAQAGVAAIRAAGIAALGIGDAATLSQAHQVFSDIASITLGHIHAAGCFDRPENHAANK